MCFDNTESESSAQTLQFQTPRLKTDMCIVVFDLNCKSSCSTVSTKRRFCQSIWLVFVFAYSRSYVWMRYENVSVSFETPSCFRNVYTRHCHELVCVRKIVTRSVQVLIGLSTMSGLGSNPAIRQIASSSGGVEVPRYFFSLEFFSFFFKKT